MIIEKDFEKEAVEERGGGWYKYLFVVS